MIDHRIQVLDQMNKNKKKSMNALLLQEQNVTHLLITGPVGLIFGQSYHVMLKERKQNKNLITCIILHMLKQFAIQWAYN